MSLWSWVNDLRRIVRVYDAEMAAKSAALGRLERIVDDAVKLIRERTEVHADVGFEDSTVIVAGRYKGRDYVNVFSLHNSNFVTLVEMLKSEQRYGRVRRVDAFGAMKAVIERELKY